MDVRPLLATWPSPPNDLPILDDVAELTVSDDLARTRHPYDTDDRLRAKSTVMRFLPELVEDTVAELT